MHLLGTLIFVSFLHSSFGGPFAEGAVGEIDGWVVSEGISEGTWLKESKSPVVLVEGALDLACLVGLGDLVTEGFIVFSTMTVGEKERVSETDGDGEKEGESETDGEDEGVSETDGKKEGVSKGLALESRTSASKKLTILLDSVSPVERKERMSKS